jgi:hypothetical protein
MLRYIIIVNNGQWFLIYTKLLRGLNNTLLYMTSKPKRVAKSTAYIETNSNLESNAWNP